MMLQIRNPMGSLTKSQRFYAAAIGIPVAVAALVGGAVWAFSGDDHPIQVGDACATFAILSEQGLTDALRDRVRKAQKKGPIDPLHVAGKYIRALAPQCPTYPGNTQNSGQVKLFATVIDRLLEVMQQENLLSSGEITTWYNMMLTWALGQGVSSEEI